MRNEVKKNDPKNGKSKTVAKTKKGEAAPPSVERQRLSRDAMAKVLRGVSQIDDEKREKMLDLLGALPAGPLDVEKVGKEFYAIWDLRDEIELDVWDKILNRVLGLKPGQATDLALAYEDLDNERKARESSDTAATTKNADAAPMTETAEPQEHSRPVESLQKDSDTHVDATPPKLGETASGNEGEAATTVNENLKSPEGIQVDDQAVEKAAKDLQKESAGNLEIVHPGGKKKKRDKEKTADIQRKSGGGLLSQEERTTLKDCLDTIRQGLDTFVEVGRAIAIIIKQKLHRETHETFEEYANEVLQMTPRRAYQLKDSSDIIQNLKENNCSQEQDATAQIPLPTLEKVST